MRVFMACVLSCFVASPEQVGSLFSPDSTSPSSSPRSGRKSMACKSSSGSSFHSSYRQGFASMSLRLAHTGQAPLASSSHLCPDMATMVSFVTLSVFVAFDFEIQLFLFSPFFSFASSDLSFFVGQELPESINCKFISLISWRFKTFSRERNRCQVASM